MLGRSRHHLFNLILLLSAFQFVVLTATFFVAADASAQSSPTITLTNPVAGATVMGTLPIEATATAGAGDYPTSISFFDGVNYIDSTSCQSQQSCSGSISWKATGLSGSHSLTAYVQTNERLSATSAAVAVNVISPPPTITVTSPGNTATVKGTVTISASAATDPSQADHPTNINFYDGVNYIDSVNCQGQQTCQGQVEWRATGLSGAHTLTASVSTDNKLSATSPPVTVKVVSPPPKVRITSPANGTPLRTTMTVSVSGSTDPSQDDYPTYINIYDSTNLIGTVSCQAQRTCGGSVKWNTPSHKGTQTLKATIHTNTSREATSHAVYVGGHPHKPHAKVSCHLASFSILVGQSDSGSCIAHNVPAGTNAVIQYRVPSGGWSTAVRGHFAGSGLFSFTLRGVKRATYKLSVLISQGSKYAATRLTIGKLYVR